MKALALADLQNQAVEAGQRYLEFLRAPALSMGLYRLKEGETDPQTPHKQDEVYYVLAGKAQFKVGEETHPVLPGAIFYVEAGTPHKFIEIKQFLEVLVFFAPAEAD